MMDELLEFINNNEQIKFIVSLDYNESGPVLYNCVEWGDLYSELGDFENNPLILNGDEDFDDDGSPDHHLWNMFAGSTYSAYALIDHNMVLRYKFDVPNLYDFQYNYIQNLLDGIYGCTDSLACNYDNSVGLDDGTCEYSENCIDCSDYNTQFDCTSEPSCIWMGDHCMEISDDCMTFQTELDCINANGCYWMGDHCMVGDSCTDPLAYNFNPLAITDDGSCIYSPYIVFGCTYIDALNFNPNANVDDGSCEYQFGDFNHDGIVDILDLVSIVQYILGN